MNNITNLDLLLSSSPDNNNAFLSRFSMSSDYSLSNRSSLGDVNHAIAAAANSSNNNTAVNTFNPDIDFDNDTINNSTVNTEIINNLWNTTSINNNMINDVNWNPNYLNSNNTTSTTPTNPMLSSPTSPIPQSFAILRNSKNLLNSQNDPFLPANLKNDLYKINSGDSLYNNNMNHNNMFINNPLNNESLLNNQFLNKSQFINNNSNFWNNNMMNLSPFNYSDQSSSTYSISHSSNASSVCDEYHNRNHEQQQSVQQQSVPHNHTKIQHSNNNNTKVDKALFKTELCATFQKTGFCPYNDKCQFAHGLDELKSSSKSKKWKTKMCKNWIETGNCRYGKRCCYKHGENDDGSLINNMLPPNIVLRHI